MTNRALKPCPFCGGEAEVAEIDTMYLHGFVARCMNDGCLITAETMCMYPTESEAAEAWNTRAKLVCRIEKYCGEWGCTACGGTVGSDDPRSELYIDGNAVELWNYCPNCGAHRMKRGDR